MFPLGGWDALEAGVQPRGVVPVDPPEDRPTGLGARGEDPALNALSLERFPERFGYCIVPTHPGGTGRGAHLAGLAEVEVVVAGVLRAAVGVGDDPGDRTVAASGGHGHAEGVEDELGAHVIGHRVADQAARGRGRAPTPGTASPRQWGCT